jgi:hypothetical protein
MKRRFTGLTFLLLGVLAGLLLDRALPNKETRVAADDADAPLVANIRFEEDAGTPATNGEPGVAAVELRSTGASGTEAAVVSAVPAEGTTPAPAHPAPAAPALEPDNTIRIPRKFLSNLNCVVIDVRSNTVADEIVELLSITPSERRRLDACMAAARARVEEHEIERATVVEQTPNRVVLKIAADPERGAALEKQFEDGVRDVLGDGAEIFLEQLRRYQSSTFSNFGRYDTTLSVTRDPSSALLRVESRQEYSTPEGGRGTMTSSSISDKMPERWNKFFQSP